MSYTKFLLFLSLGMLFAMCAAKPVKACSCAGEPAVLDSYEGATQVIVAKAISVEKIDPDRKPQPDKNGYDSGEYRNIRSTTMQVEKVFKGTLKAGEEIKFIQGGGADCIWTFDEKAVGVEFVFYLYSKDNKPDYWYAGTCGRSTGLKYAGDDLLYLENMAKVRGKTRISGTLRFSRDTNLSVAGRIVRIIGSNKTYEVKTDKNGVYEIYGLPAGKYQIAPEIPAGWKIDSYWARESSGFAGDEEDVSRKVPIVLPDKKHAGMNIYFEIDNAIRGKLFDTGGKPLKGVCIHAVHPKPEEPVGYHADCTEQDGSFSITELPPGEYILVVNNDGKISSNEPFPTFFYPNVFERGKAAVLNIETGDILEGLNIYAPTTEELITVTGLLLYADGKPVVGERVEFRPENAAHDVEGKAATETDKRGRFSINILKGLRGSLQGQMYTYGGEFENCPKLDALIAKTGQQVPEITTPAIPMQADSNLDNVTLKFSFPSCKKARP